MENVRKHSDIKHVNADKRKKFSDVRAKLLYRQSFPENLFTIETKKKQLQ